MMAPIPDEIVQRVIKLQAKGWPGMVEFPSGKKRLWTNIEDATVAQLEQAVEMETRRARKAILRFMETGSKYAASKAAMCINRARSFRDWSLQNQKQPVTEEALPFPCMSLEQMQDHLEREKQ